MQKQLLKKLCISFLLTLTALMGCSLLYSHIHASDSSEQADNTSSSVTQENQTVTQETTSDIEPSSLIEQIQAYLEANHIDTNAIAISIYDIENEQSYEINEMVDFISASLYKVPLAMLYYEFLEDGSMQASDTLSYCSTCYEEGGPIGTTYMVGAQIPLSELLYDVIVYSDNTAGHILFESLGGWENYRQAILKYSAQTTAFTYIEENSFSAMYAMDVLRTLYDHEERYAQLIEDMRLVYPEDYLNRSLLQSSAQKYGSYGMQRNAMGIVYGEHPYLIVVLTNLGENGVEVIGDINKIAYTSLYAN